MNQLPEITTLDGETVDSLIATNLTNFLKKNKESYHICHECDCEPYLFHTEFTPEFYKRNCRLVIVAEDSGIWYESFKLSNSRFPIPLAIFKKKEDLEKLLGQKEVTHFAISEVESSDSEMFEEILKVFLPTNTVDSDPQIEILPVYPDLEESDPETMEALRAIQALSVRAREIIGDYPYLQRGLIDQWL